MILEQIGQLKSLLDSNVITGEQFENEREKLVKELNKIE